MLFVCHSYVTRMYSYVIRMSLLCARKSSLCTRMSFVYHSDVVVCHPYVTRMSSVCHSYVLVCHPYVTLVWFHHEPSATSFKKIHHKTLICGPLTKLATKHNVITVCLLLFNFFFRWIEILFFVCV